MNNSREQSPITDMIERAANLLSREYAQPGTVPWGTIAEAVNSLQRAANEQQANVPDDEWRYVAHLVYAAAFCSPDMGVLASQLWLGLPGNHELRSPEAAAVRAHLLHAGKHVQARVASVEAAEADIIAWSESTRWATDAGGGETAAQLALDAECIGRIADRRGHDATLHAADKIGGEALRRVQEALEHRT